MSPKETKYGIGAIIADCLLMVEVIVDIYTGELTWFKLLIFILLGTILSATIIALARRRRRKERAQFSAKTSEKEKSTRITNEE